MYVVEVLIDVGCYVCVYCVVGYDEDYYVVVGQYGCVQVQELLFQLFSFVMVILFCLVGLVGNVKVIGWVQEEQIDVVWVDDDIVDVSVDVV